MIGRRVASKEALVSRGDYYRDGDTLWYLVPLESPVEVPEDEDEPHRLAREHIYLPSHITSPPWGFVECPDGSLKVEGSIRITSWTGWSWHGYLHEGHMWETL